MSDLISRQAAIVAIEQHKTAVLEGHKWDEGIEYGYAAAHRHIVDIVEQLPSVQPDTTTDGSNVVKKGGNDEDRISGDCISRTRAIDTIEKHLKWTTIPDYYPGIFEAVRGWLNGLPPVQPETNCSEIPNNSDTISRRQAIRWVKQECNPYGKPTLDFESGKRVMEHLERMPSAQPETCEGCKHLGKWENEVEYGYPSPCTRCKRRVNDNYER